MPGQGSTDESLERRTALVTGATGALGRHVVKTLIGRGARVHAAWQGTAGVEELRTLLGGAAGEVQLHQADVTDDEQVRELVGAVEADGGGLDILCNLVGGFVFAPLEETDPETWDRMMAINATSAFLCSREASAAMRRRGWGRIVNVAAFPALGRGQAGLAAYSASKAALLNLTYTLAAELVGDGVTVNAVVPRIIDTPDNRKAMPDADHSSWVPPSEIAELIAFVVGERTRALTGAVLTLDLG